MFAHTVWVRNSRREKAREQHRTSRPLRILRVLRLLVAKIHKFMNIKTANEYCFFIILNILRKDILRQNYTIITVHGI